MGGTEELEQGKVRTDDVLEVESHFIDVDQHLYKNRPQLMHLLPGNVTLAGYDAFILCLINTDAHKIATSSLEPRTRCDDPGLPVLLIVQE
jgi:hypothetical protein